MASTGKEVTLTEVLSAGNLAEALEAVKRNRGAAGIDGKDIEATERHLQTHWNQIEAKLRAGHYRPSPVKGIYIPKASGGQRLLGIPTVQDRIIQQAIQQQLGWVFDPTFSAHSYGFRPNRSAHGAVKAAQHYVASGKEWVIDLDIEAFFDHVNHDLLMQRLKQAISDPLLLALINRYLKAGIVINDHWQATPIGTPQGSPLSPLLANIYLDPLDRELERRGLNFCRYADDTNVYVSSERSAQRVYNSLVIWIEKHLKLRINAGKSGTGHPWERQFLGFSLGADGEISIAPSRIERYKAQVRRLWDARQSLTSQELVKQWQDYLRGWVNYFKLADIPRQMKRWTGWTRRHMRKCFWLRWHNRKGRKRALHSLGIRGDGLKVASSSRGAWRIAACPTLHRALNNATLKRYGLYVPADLWAA
jgi:group II intron reverse transcriptase/maturase